MSVVTPRPPRSDDRTDAEALEALIEEARRRARRRRRGYAAAVLVAVAAGLLGFYGFNHGDAKRPADRTNPPEAQVAVPQIADGGRRVGGLGGAAIRALELDPKNPNTLFAATLEAGVFKSTDRGRRWRPLDIGPYSNRVDALALAPSDPKIVYAGTGGGIFKSTTGGRTWQAMNSGLFGEETPWDREYRLGEGFVYELAVGRTNPEFVYAATWARGLLRSTDGGGSWQAPGDKHFPVTALALDPTDPKTVYVGNGWGRQHGRPDPGVMTSTDGGASWRTGGLRGHYVTALAVAPDDPKTVYAGTDAGLFKSSAGGTTWHTTSLKEEGISALVFNPENSATVYALTERRIFTSADKGRTWRPLGPEWAPSALALDPRNTATMYAAFWPAGEGQLNFEAGVYKSVDGGQSWESMNAGLTDARVSALVLDPRSPGTAYAGIDGRGVFKRANGQWQAANKGLTSAGIHAIAVDPGDPTEIYAGTDRGLFKSTSRGRSWRHLRVRMPGHSTISALVVEPHRGTVYATTADESTRYGSGLATVYRSYVFKSGDGGLTWRKEGLQTLKVPAPAGATVASRVHGSPLAIDPGRSSTLYAGGLGIFKSVDGGTTWRHEGLMQTPVVSLALDHTQPATVYAGTDAGLFKSTDGGVSWQALHGMLDGLRVEAVAIDPSRHHVLYAGTDHGVAWSVDGGQSWRRFTRLPLRTFDALAIDRAAGKIYAGAYGGGIHELEIRQ